jgi:hypothetical protein
VPAKIREDTRRLPDIAIERNVPTKSGVTRRYIWRGGAVSNRGAYDISDSSHVRNIHWIEGRKAGRLSRVYSWAIRRFELIAIPEPVL